MNYLISSIAAAQTMEMRCQKLPYVAWDTSEGFVRFQSSNAKENFWKLTRYYESQPNLTFCAVATAVIALNALDLVPQSSKKLGKYRLFNQEELYEEYVCNLFNRNKLEQHGISLDDLTLILKQFPLKVQQLSAIDLSAAEIREQVIPALKNSKQIVLALYLRTKLEQDGIGHWSPIAAYDEVSDSFLVLDVARFKYPPLWIDSEAFIEATRTIDACGCSRGYLIIERCALPTTS